MSFNFDEIINRRSSDSMKWSVGDDELPLWVADMDFRAAPCITEALEQRLKHGIFGYTEVPDAWYTAIQSWWRRRHGFDMDESGLIFATGVVPALSTAVKRLTNVGDQVLIQTPVYNIFFNSIVNHGRHIVESPLVYKEGRYQIDFVDLETKLSQSLTTMMILCNPHNPIGMVWDRETLERIGELCAKHHVTVVSDEIHCDITARGVSYTPFASVNSICEQISVSLLSASKAFNLAGLQSAIVYIPHPALRAKMTRGLNSDEVAEPNAFACIATVAAFNEGEAWLDALRAYIDENKALVVAFIKEKALNISVPDSQATYLLWLDLTAIDADASKVQAFLRTKFGLYLSEGAQFGQAGRAFLRMNVACPKSVLLEALERFEKGIKAYPGKGFD